MRPEPRLLKVNDSSHRATGYWVPFPEAGVSMQVEFIEEWLCLNEYLLK